MHFRITVFATLFCLCHVFAQICFRDFLLYKSHDITGTVVPLRTLSVPHLNTCLGNCSIYGKCRSFLLQTSYTAGSYPLCYLFRSNLDTPGVKLHRFNPHRYPKFDYYEKTPECLKKTSGAGPETQPQDSGSRPKTQPRLAQQNQEWSLWSHCSATCGGGVQIRERYCPECGYDDQLDKQYLPCNFQSCPGALDLAGGQVEGYWTVWTPWSRCSEICGGSQKRARRCKPEKALCNGQGLTQEAQTRHCKCQRFNFKSTARWTGWSRWSSCSVSCGKGERTRKRQCTVPDACSGLYEVKEMCTLPTCLPPVPKWEKWAPWSICSVSCGNGVRTRMRKCINGNCQGDRFQNRPCRLQSCVGERGWESWQPWTQCSVTCGPGVQSRSRMCPSDRMCQGSSIENQSCSNRQCSTTSGWNPWNSWSSCSRTCGSGTKTKTRTCPEFANCPGTPFETEECFETECSGGPPWSPWNDWSDCSSTCGAGTRARTRICPPYANCDGPPFDTEECFEMECSSSTGWTTWTQWSSCSATCGYASRTRNRFCTGGAHCSGSGVDSEECEEVLCPGEQQWLPWNEWSSCSLSCDVGQKTRVRVCPNGGDCDGSAFQTDPCFVQECPEPPGWNSWLQWTFCSVTCGEGTRTRARTCPESSNCPGQTFNQENCVEEPCFESQGWNSWNPWSSCSVSCDEGTRSRTRICPSYENCQGDPFETESCLDEECVEVLEWTPWSPWTTCSVTCGEGTRSRTRACPEFVPNVNCPGEPFDTAACFEMPCTVPPEWTTWGQWSTCSTSCDQGSRTRARTCLGANCLGQPFSVEECYKIECPGPSAWSTWNEWSSCSVSCGEGTITRTRTCLGNEECPGQMFTTEICFDELCPTAPGWNSWNSWTSCSVSCGVGTITRTRVCPVNANCPGQPFDTSSCSVDCTTSSTPSGCQPWTHWGPCSITCGSGGTQSRNRICSANEFGEIDQKLCYLDACETSVWLSWAPWTDCSVTCGNGLRFRTRQCTDFGQCTGRNSEEDTCFLPICGAFVWSPWGSWSECSVSCGDTGIQIRNRQCSIHGSCPGQGVERQICDPGSCMGWNPWSQWSDCSVSCGDTGIQTRNRQCRAPASCLGLNIERQICDPGSCTDWSPWSAWTSCSTTCDQGLKSRSRTCPAPSLCTGNALDTMDCFNQPCDISQPFWLTWDPWTPCSATCGFGEKVRVRSCSVPNACVGRNAVSDPCDGGACLFLDWSPWSPWSICSTSCETGMRMRARACPKTNLCEGSPESALDMELCNTQTCPLLSEQLSGVSDPQSYLSLLAPNQYVHSQTINATKTHKNNTATFKIKILPPSSKNISAPIITVSLTNQTLNDFPTPAPIDAALWFGNREKVMENIAVVTYTDDSFKKLRLLSANSSEYSSRPNRSIVEFH